MFIGTDLRGADFVNAFLVGARFNGANVHDVRNLDRAIFRLWMNPKGGKPSYDPVEGWIEVDTSLLGDISLQENSARGPARRRGSEANDEFEASVRAEGQETLLAKIEELQ